MGNFKKVIRQFETCPDFYLQSAFDSKNLNAKMFYYFRSALFFVKRYVDLIFRFIDRRHLDSLKVQVSK